MKTFAVATTLFALAHCGTVTWTGVIGDQQWSNANNWSPNTVPGPADDAVINGDDKGTDTTVVVSDKASVKSLTVGDASANVRVQLKEGIVVQDSTQVAQNGYFELSAGPAALSCNNVTVAGEFNFQAGTILGNYHISGTANFGTLAAKIFNSAQVVISSVLDFEACGSLQFNGGSTITAKGDVVATGTQFAVQKMDDSTGNKFDSPGFTWVSEE